MVVFAIFVNFHLIPLRQRLKGFFNRLIKHFHMYPKVTLNQSKTEIWIQVDAQSNPFAVKIEDILAAQSMGGMGRVLTIADLAISLHDEITS